MMVLWNVGRGVRGDIPGGIPGAGRRITGREVMDWNWIMVVLGAAVCIAGVLAVVMT